jgi:hypothetical protein
MKLSCVIKINVKHKADRSPWSFLRDFCVAQAPPDLQGGLMENEDRLFISWPAAVDILHNNWP